MFSVDASPDLVRVVVSDSDASLINHALLLAAPVPLGTEITNFHRNDLWDVEVSVEEHRVALRTHGGDHVLTLQFAVGEPCRLTLDVGGDVEAWGLGQCFRSPDARVDWVAHRRQVDAANVKAEFKPYGHGLQTYVAGVEGYIQIPVLLVAGGPQPFGLVLDYPYRIEADFSATPWSWILGSEPPAGASLPIRAYVVGGATPLDVRRRIMDLLGRPPLPPRKALGMWVSEYGFETWPDVQRVLDGHREGAFPIDGIVLDLYWFGGVGQEGDHSDMGRLGWDITDDPGDDPYFPDPQATLARYANDHVGFALIEESYVNGTTDTFGAIQTDVPDAFVRDGGSVLRFYGLWVGEGAAMLDWTNPDVGDWIHRHRRKPYIVDYGVQLHWTDLGEPEIFRATATYHGVDLEGSGTRRTGHRDVANLYNLEWHRSIHHGYAALDGDRRKLLLARSGTAGIQRFGTAMWSGDTGSTMEVLVGQLHTQAHMSCSGIDYFGSDVAGFRREATPAGHFGELYTQWFANSAWFDVPLRPHADNSAYYVDRGVPGKNTRRYPVGPFEVGHIPSNRSNLRTRYRLVPYYYALARRAAETGAPMFPPPSLVYPDAPLRGIAHQKLIGEDLMVAVAARHGEYARSVYLPAGTWYDFHSGERYASRGEWFDAIPEYRDGRFRLPAFARAGAIIPLMHVDEDTLDAFGHRRSGGRFEDLILRVFNDEGAPSSFAVFEDDGTTVSSPSRDIVVERARRGRQIVVTVRAADRVAGLADRRPLIIELVSAAEIGGVTLNGAALDERSDASRQHAGWTRVDTRTVRACLPGAEVATDQAFAFSVAGAAPVTTSLLLVCDRAFTIWGEDVYARFSTALRSANGTVSELRLDPSVTYEYLYPQAPPEQSDCPIWTAYFDELEPDQEVRVVFEKRRGGEVLQSSAQEFARSCGPGGYAGELRGSLA